MKRKRTLPPPPFPFEGFEGNDLAGFLAFVRMLVNEELDKRERLRLNRKIDFDDLLRSRYGSLIEA